MKIIVVDRDASSVAFIMSRLRGQEHEIESFTDREIARQYIINNRVDLIMIDTAPLRNPRSIIQNFRHSVDYYPYIFLMSDSISAEESIKSGANDLLSKPFDIDSLSQRVSIVQAFIDFVNHIGANDEDYPNSGGIISKSAFNQLFLSSIDRANRYGEISYVLVFSIDNLEQITESESIYSARRIASNLSKSLLGLRRQSDILAQTGEGEFTLLVLNPQNQIEALLATKRFYQAISSTDNLFEDSFVKPDIRIKLIPIPSGVTEFNQVINS